MDRLSQITRFLLAVLAVGLLFPGREAAAQAKTRVQGVVSDLDGKPISGATVKVLNKGSQRTYTAQSKDDGKYSLIVDGQTLTFTVSAKGFQTFEEERAVATLGRKPTLNIQLAPEGAKVVEVAPAAPEATPEPKIDLADLKAGNLLFEQGQYKEAVASYQVALAKNPTLNQIHIAIADAYVKMEDWPNALAEYKLVPDTDPMSERALIGGAGALVRMSKSADAVTMYKQVLAKNPQNPDANYMVGQVIFNDQNDAQAALPYLEAAAAAKPDWAPVHVKLGYVYVNLGDNAKAKAAFSKALELEPGNAEAKSMLEMFK